MTASRREGVVGREEGRRVGFGVVCGSSLLRRVVAKMRSSRPMVKSSVSSLIFISRAVPSDDAIFIFCSSSDGRSGC